jgi:hypothetical protein
VTRERLVRELRYVGICWSILVTTAATVGGMIGWVEIRRERG